MFGLGLWELVVLLVIVLLIFGASRLPEIGSGLGKGIANFRQAAKEAKGIEAAPEKNKDQNASEKDSKTV